MTNFMKCQESWNVKCYEMPNVMKCQISWNDDAWSMTPSRNSRRYTLRSVQSSPGRSFFIWQLGLSVLMSSPHIATVIGKYFLYLNFKSKHRAVCPWVREDPLCIMFFKPSYNGTWGYHPVSESLQTVQNLQQKQIGLFIFCIAVFCIAVFFIAVLCIAVYRTIWILYGQTGAL